MLELTIMKRDEVALSAILVPVDALMIVLAFTVSYWLRLQTEVIYLLDFPLYLQFVFSVLPVWLLVFALEGLYRVGSARRGFDELAGIFVGVSLGVLLVMAAIFLTNTELNSRVILIYAYVLSLGFVWLGRWFIRSIQQLFYRYGVGLRRTVLIGSNNVALQLAAEMIHRSELGYAYLGYVEPENKAKKVPGLGKRLGSIDDLSEIINRQYPNELIVADSSLSDSTMLQILSLSNERRIDLRLSPNILGVQTSHVTYQAMAGIPLIEVQRTPLQGWGRVLKRVADVVGAFVGIVVFSPLMIVTALAVRLTSAGPIIYKNERVGQEKELFNTYKFRTMRIEYCVGDQYGGTAALKQEEELIQSPKNTRTGALYKIADDPRLTPIGDFLRKTSLDEFPQFFNVLFGTMSLVGPRPHQPREVAKYKPWQEKLFTIKPGITGMAQISGRSNLDFDDEARLDISYIENWSPWLDLSIFIRKPITLLQKRKAV